MISLRESRNAPPKTSSPPCSEIYRTCSIINNNNIKLPRPFVRHHIFSLLFNINNSKLLRLCLNLLVLLLVLLTRQNSFSVRHVPSTWLEVKLYDLLTLFAEFVLLRMKRFCPRTIIGTLGVCIVVWPWISDSATHLCLFMVVFMPCWADTSFLQTRRSFFYIL